MKLSISNIAWPDEAEADVAALMQELGVDGVEVAPTKKWPSPPDAPEDEVRDYRRFWNESGIEVVAMQALLYGRPDLTLFESAEARARTLAYLRGVMRVGGLLGASALVFGSPKNRRVGDLDPERAHEIAVEFFRAAGRAAADHGVVLCIEPNPADYQCDFVTTTPEALALVERVDEPGFGLHLDTGGMTLAGETPSAVIDACGARICHFHASEPFLAALGSGGGRHDEAAAALRRIAYPNRVSVEMRHDPKTETLPELRRVLTLLRDVYGD